MKLSRLLSISALLLIATMAQAVPAKPGVKKTMQRADGTQLAVTLCGDEHFSYFTDAASQPYMLNTDGLLQAVSADIIGTTWADRKAQRLSAAAVTDRVGQRHAAPSKAGKPSTATKGRHRGLVILMQFDDVKFVTENPKETFTRFFNEAGYTDYGMTGSVRDYFLKQSYGQLEIDFDVVGPYTTVYEMKYYGAHDGDSNDSRPASIVAEGVDAASKEVNFANYDWDNDGEVDQVFVIYAGYAEAQGADPNTIWPHEWALAGQGISRRYNNRRINTYGCASELRGSGASANPRLDGIGTACHEFSHCLGLPDMYDTSGNNFAMGYWDVMCAGSYNGNSCTPAGYTSYERWFAGWMEPVELTTLTRVSDMKPIATTPEAYILYNEANRNEYYMLENRQPVDFDRALPGHGMLVLHVAYDESAWTGNRVNNTANLQRMTIIPADNMATTSTMAGDPFPGTRGVTMLTTLTTPAATLYYDNTDGTKLMNKDIDNISEDTSAKTISFVACRPPLAAPSLADATGSESGTSYTVAWPAVDGAEGYAIELTEVGAAPTSPAEALQREFTFDGFVSKTAGFTDVSTNMSKYGLTGWSGTKLYTTPSKMRIGTSTTTGSLRTPTWAVPESSEMTIVMGADVVKAGTAVEGTMQIAYGNSGDQATREELPFTVTASGRLVFHFTVRKDLFWLEIHPASQMYLNYLAVYDGTWSAEQLGISSGSTARSAAPRRATTVTQHTTATNSYTFTNLNTRSRFSYRVRTLGAEGTFSAWSEEKSFVFENQSAVRGITAEPAAPAAVYDLNGRRIAGPADALPRGIYISGGKKRIIGR